MKGLSSTFFKRNRKKLAGYLEDNSCCILFGNPHMFYDESESYRFRQNSDFFYFTGLKYPGLILAILKINGNTEERIYIEEPTEFRKQWESDVLEKDKAIEISGIKNVLWLERFEEDMNDLMNEVHNYYSRFHKGGHYNSGKDYHNRMSTRIKRKFPHLKKINILPVIHRLRTIKHPEEIELIRQSVKITSGAFKSMSGKIDTFSTEKEIELFLEYEMKQMGAGGFAFDPIIASGKNACVLHYSSNSDQLRKGQLILMDIGAKCGNYNTDITRVIPYSSKMSTRQKSVYLAVREVYEEIEKKIKPGMCIADINLETAKAIEEKLLQLGLLTSKDIELQKKDVPAYKKYYMHSASHFLGLEVHDVGDRRTPLEKGMVITLEPGIYIDKEGIGIRLENDLLITSNGTENLTKEIPFH